MKSQLLIWSFFTAVYVVIYFSVGFKFPLQIFQALGAGHPAARGPSGCSCGRSCFAAPTSPPAPPCVHLPLLLPGRQSGKDSLHCPQAGESEGLCGARLCHCALLHVPVGVPSRVRAVLRRQSSPLLLKMGPVQICFNCFESLPLKIRRTFSPLHL